MTLGEILRAAREKAGLRQSDLASRADLTQSDISELEQGQAVNPGLKRLEAIARALGMSTGKLLKDLD